MQIFQRRGGRGGTCDDRSSGMWPKDCPVGVRHGHPGTSGDSGSCGVCGAADLNIQLVPVIAGIGQTVF